LSHEPHPGAAHSVTAGPASCPPDERPAFGVSILGRKKGDDATSWAVLTLAARDRHSALVKAEMLAGRLMPRSRGWRGVKWAVSTGAPVDVARVMLGEDGP
jgi:hypothetical protein